MGYHRFNWVDLEPSDNQFDFSKIESWIHTFCDKMQRKFAFGVMCVNTSSTKEYITPKFVFDQGAAYDIHTADDGTRQYIPKWDDEVYLAQVDELTAELGRRYNGDPRIAFVDILSYGNWGEQHLFGLNTGIENYSEVGKVSPEFFRDRYVEPYRKAFPDTLLYNSWGYDALNEVYEELIEEGVSIRRNGIVSYTNGLDMLAKAYGKLPVAFEFAKSYTHYAEEGREQYFHDRLEEAIAAAKPSYIELDVDWYRANTAYCEELANRMGYYFRLKKANYPKRLKANTQTSVTLFFRNDGIAPLYEDGCVFVALLDGEGGVIEKYPTSIDPKTWAPSTTVEEKIALKIGDLAAGSYRLAVGLFGSAEDAAPLYLLGSEGKTEENWYVFGTAELTR